MLSGPESTGGEMWPPAMQELPAPCKMLASPLQGPPRICTRNLKELCEWGSLVWSGEAGQGPGRGGGASWEDTGPELANHQGWSVGPPL